MALLTKRKLQGIWSSLSRTSCSSIDTYNTLAWKLHQPQSHISPRKTRRACGGFCSTSQSRQHRSSPLSGEQHSTTPEVPDRWALMLFPLWLMWWWKETVLPQSTSCNSWPIITSLFRGVLIDPFHSPAWGMNQTFRWFADAFPLRSSLSNQKRGRRKTGNTSSRESNPPKKLGIKQKSKP